MRLTTPLRTALDVGRLLPAGQALAAMDALLAGGSFTHAALLAELPRFGGHAGVGQLRALAAQVDARSACPAESLLRLHWNAARLPTPVPGMPVAAGPRLVRLSLGGRDVASSAPFSPTRSPPTTCWPSRAPAGGSSYSLRSGCSPPTPPSGSATSSASSTSTCSPR